MTIGLPPLRIGVLHHPTGHNVVGVDDQGRAHQLAVSAHPQIADRIAHLLTMFGLEDSAGLEDLLAGTEGTSCAE